MQAKKKTKVTAQILSDSPHFFSFLKPHLNSQIVKTSAACHTETCRSPRRSECVESAVQTSAGSWTGGEMQPLPAR